ncbi:MAG: exosortase system-associated protein, TIGR04073 family [Candidatus Omnitrophota bacterium]
MKKVILVALVAIFALSFTCAYAQSPIIKLGRGLTNTASGWLELVKQPYETTKAENLLAGLTVGILKGVGMGLVRTGVGIYELITFPIPAPKGFEPLLQPEYVFNGSK